MWHVTYDSSYSGGTRLEKVLTRQQIIRFYYASPSFSNKETAFIVFKYGRKTLSHILESEFEFLLSGASTYPNPILEHFGPNWFEWPIAIQGHLRSPPIARVSARDFLVVTAFSKILDFLRRLPQDIRNDWESQNCEWVLFLLPDF